MLINLLHIFFLFTAFYALGSIILKKIFFSSSIEDYLFKTATGIIAVFCILITLGSTGYLKIKYVRIFFFIQTAITLFFLPEIYRIVRKIFCKKNFSISEKILIGLVLLNAVMHLPGALTPVVGLDGLTYHLTLPKIYLQESSVKIVDFLFYSFFPQFSEMLFLYGLSTGGPICAQLYHWFFFIISIILFYRFARICGIGRFLSLTAILCFMSTPALNRLAGYLKNDFFIIFFSGISLFSLYSFVKLQEKKFYFFCILFTATGNNIKYNAIIHTIIILAAVILYYCYNRIKSSDEKLTQGYFSFSRLILFLVALFVLSSPFYIRNYIAVGNPVYPFKSNFFKFHHTNFSKIKGADEILRRETSMMVRHFSEDKPKTMMSSNLFFFPYQVSVDFPKFDYWKYSITPLFFIFILFTISLFLFMKPDPCLILLVIYVLGFTYLTGWNAGRGRYLLTVYPVVCITGMMFFQTLKTRYYGMFYKINIVIVFAVIILNFPFLAAQHFNRYKVLFGFETEYEYLSKRMYADGEFYQAITWVNENLPKKTKIFVTHQQTFYFKPEIMLGYSPSFPLSPINNITVKNSDNLYSELKKNGINYIFFSEKYAQRFCYNTAELIKSLEKSRKINAVKRFNNNIIFELL